MGVCSPGVTQPKTGVQRTVVMTTAAVEAALAFLDPIVAVVLAPLIAGFSYDTVTICGAEPPADPVLTSNDVADALNFQNPLVSTPAIARIHQWFLSWYWYVVCGCSGSVVPSPPTPSNPGPSASQNPGLPSAPAAAKCWDVTNNFVLVHNNVLNDLTAKALPTQAPVTVTPPSGYPPQAYSIPAGVTAIVFTGALSGGGFGSQWPHIDLTEYKADGTELINQVPITWTTVGTITHSVNLTPGAASWTLTGWNPGISSPDQSLNLEVSFYCGGGSAVNLNAPCCPPDESLLLILQQVLGLSLSIYQGLPVPLSSYAEATVHAGLTGHGTITLAAAVLGVKVTITADTSNQGESLGTPEYLFDRGFIVPIAAEGPIRTASRLVFNPQLFQLPVLTEQVGYTLAPGVTVSIIELVRGP